MKYDTAAKLTFSLFDGWETYGYDPDYYKDMIVTIKEIIYRCPTVHSGYVSETGSEKLTKDLCKEHYYSRTQSAQKIVNYIQKGIFDKDKPEKLEQFLKSRSRVHYVTSEENTKLIKYQFDPSLTHWKKQYEAAGINLVKFEPKLSRNIYEIDGKEYSSIHDVIAEYKLSESTLRKRFSSEKWPNWKTRKL